MSLPPSTAAFTSVGVNTNPKRNAFIKALLYVSYTIAGHAYPYGELDKETANSARSDIIKWL